MNFRECETVRNECGLRVLKEIELELSVNRCRWIKQRVMDAQIEATLRYASNREIALIAG